MKLNKKLRYIFLVQVAFFLIGAFMLNTGAYGQEAEKVTVNGVIVDNNGEPLAGATVMVDGTTNGVLSDAQGAFSISTTKGKDVVISFMGYKTQKITATSSEKLTIKLDSNSILLNEATVVVVGYGTMRKSDLTGAIASVSADNLKKGVVTSSEQLLQGRVAGLTVIQGSGDPSVGASVRLRGGTSLSAANSPLFVVDGVPGVDINSIQPSEIVSMDVLKDASAAAIYGSRGANGVIIITTNRAQKGKFTEYSGYVAVSQVAHHLDLLSADQWRKYVRDNNVANATDYGGNTDWQKELEQTGVSQSHTLSFNNANDNGGYHVSLNYLNNQGIIKTSYLERMGLSASAFHYALNKKLKLEAGVNTNFDRWSVTDDQMFIRAYNLNPTIPVKGLDGKYSSVPGQLYENPVEILNDRDSEDTRHRLLGFGKAELDIVKGLKGVVNVSYEYNSHQSALYIPTYRVNSTTNGNGSKSLGDYRNKQIETYLSYNKNFGEHKLGLMGGYSYLANEADGFGAYRQGFSTDLFGYNNLGAGYDAQAGDVYSYKNASTLVSFYGRVNYTFKGRYMFTGTLRDDGSSKFGANNKWGLFPSASFAWRISDESFMKKAVWLNNLKLRIGYGVTGNQDAIPSYSSLYIIGTSTTTGSVPYYDPTSGKWLLSYGPSQNPNPALKWESTATTNIGLDFGIFNKITGTIEVYQKNTYDLLHTYQVPTPPYVVGYQLANVGDMSNKGIEFSLNANIMKTKDFSWDVNFNVSHNLNKVTKLSNQTYQADAFSYGNLNTLPGMTGIYAETLRKGYAVGTFWGPKCHGIDSNGKFVVDTFNSDLGNYQPKFNLGIGMNFSYKNFDLAISGYGMFGQKVLNATAMVLNDNTRLPFYNVTDAFLTSGIKQTPSFNSYWVQDASFFRLQSVTLGYNLKLKKFGVDKIRLYVTGENLFVITKYKGIDPEVSIASLDYGGIEGLVSTADPKTNYLYPKARTFSFGVNVSF